MLNCRGLLVDRGSLRIFGSSRSTGPIPVRPVGPVSRARSSALPPTILAGRLWGPLGLAVLDPRRRTR
nr:hypothetical protein [Streptomyces genisteinicus]